MSSSPGSDLDRVALRPQCRAETSRVDFGSVPRVIPVATRWLVAAWAGLLVTACASEDVQPLPPRPVIVEALQTGTSHARELSYSGRVESGAETALGFMVQGRLARLHVDDGQSVQAGDVLAELDAGDYRVEQRQAQVAERTALADVRRRRELVAEGILAPAALELAETELATARAQREAADRQVAHTRLRAPYAGRVARRQMDPGAVVTPGEPVLSLQADDGFNVVVELAERDAMRLPMDASLVARGQLLSVPDAPPIALAYREHATVPADNARTYRLVFRGEAPAGPRMLPGTTMRVHVADPGAGVLAAGLARVPLSGVLSTPEGESRVWVVENGEAASRVVEIVELDEAFALVRGEFAPDVQVVVAGARQLVEGQRVEPRLRK